MKYEVVPATIPHLMELSETMRWEDMREIWASAHYTPMEALVAGVRYSDNTYAGLVNGKVLCVFGMGKASYLSDTGVPWMLSSDLVGDHMRVWAKGSKAAFQEMTRSGVKRLENYVDARYTVAVRWLGWLGFTIHHPEPFGVEQRPFHRFTWEKESG